METINKKEHWDKIYSIKQPDQLSWFQTYPKTSMEFLMLFNLAKDAGVIDIGGGDSNFVDTLLEQGYTNITVLDISENAIERAKKRLGEAGDKVNWIVTDVTEFKPTRKYNFWHDRAAFHFLVAEELADKYVQIVNQGVAENGFLILGTFSEKGPDSCSGLNVKQYSEGSMSAKFENGFKRIKCIEEDHQTPFNTMQNFLFCSFQRLKE
jgi:cyclopropane fatty-acyl-phospholipid synthase-like methyltransferase